MNLLNVFPSYRKLVEDYDKLCGDFEKLVQNETTLYQLSVDNGRITAEIGTEMLKVIANQFAALLKEHDAKNYLEMSFHSEDEQNKEINLILTLRYENGKTPHTLRIEAEKERDELKAEVLKLKKELSSLKETSLAVIGELK